MNMRYGEIKILCWAVLSFFLFSCEKDEPDIVTTSRKTLFMYLPWSSNLTTNFYTNISDMDMITERTTEEDSPVRKANPHKKIIIRKSPKGLK